MSIRFPAPLRPGDTIAVTAPSNGVTEAEHARMEMAVSLLQDRGFTVVIGNCMDGSTHVSAPASERAAELTRFLTDPVVRAVIPPRGGSMAIELLPLMGWEAIRDAEPTWFIGFSDISTLITPVTTLTGMATIHGNNLMDTPYETPEGLLNWLDITALETGSSFSQTPPGRYRKVGSDDYITDPDVTTMTLDTAGSWVRLDQPGRDVEVSGRLIGGCIDTLCNLDGTAYTNLNSFAEQYAPEGLIIYIEASDKDALIICRYLHGMRLAGFFDRANAVLVGRTRAPDTEYMTQKDAVLDALGSLDVPIIADVECGHVQPFMPIINGALGHVVFRDGMGSLEQALA